MAGAGLEIWRVAAVRQPVPISAIIINIAAPPMTAGRRNGEMGLKQFAGEAGNIFHRSMTNT